MLNLLAQGFDLMLVGMGSVFAFLVVLIGALQVVSHLITRFIPAEIAPTRRGVVSAEPTDEELVAITSAIITHRQKS